MLRQIRRLTTQCYDSFQVVSSEATIPELPFASRLDPGPTQYSSGKLHITRAKFMLILTAIRADPNGSIVGVSLLPADIFQSICPWYRNWVINQISQQPTDTFYLIKDAANDKSIIQNEQFLSIWSEILQSLSRVPSNSIDSIVEDLISKDLLQIDSHIPSHDIPSHARYLVFAIIGWQTMLFKPDRLSYPVNRFGIIDETNGFRGRRHTQLSQPDSEYINPLHKLLFRFGLILPPRGLWSNLPVAPEDKAKGRATFSSESFNAHLLTAICGINLIWTDSLACHLEFVTADNTLYIFRYPSFCVAHLQTEAVESSPKTTLHACAKPVTSDDVWATIEDINRLLTEVLLSYRILFGMEKVSRRYFRHHNPFLGVPQIMKDKMLQELCGRKRPQLSVSLSERDNFDLARDFPILRDRLLPLLNALSAAKPRNFGQLWSDRRDSSTWFAFWVILFIGVIGLVLALLQVILQIVQIALQPH